MLRFLADESCDWAVVRSPRDAGYDVLAVRDVAPGVEDELVMTLAAEEGRILLTEDKDFGRLAYASLGSSGGVVLLRFPIGARRQVASELVELVRARGSDLRGALAVVQPGRVRLRRLRRE